MRKFTILAFLCVFTLTACQNHTTGPNNTTASVKVTLDSGGENSEWEELTGGAVRFREWLNELDTERAESVPKDGLSYSITLRFGTSAPIYYRYVNCGEHGSYLLSEGEWYSVKNPSAMPVGYARELGIAVSSPAAVEHSRCGVTTEAALSEEQTEELAEWLGGLKYEKREFAEGEAPGDCDGGEVYAFIFPESGFSYVDNGKSGRYLLVGGEWYCVQDPSEPPIEAFEPKPAEKTPLECRRFDEFREFEDIDFSDGIEIRRVSADILLENIEEYGGKASEAHGIDEIWAAVSRDYPGADLADWECVVHFLTDDKSCGIIRLLYRIGDIQTNKAVVCGFEDGRAYEICYTNMGFSLSEDEEAELLRRKDDFLALHIQEKRTMGEGERVTGETTTFTYYYNLDKLAYSYALFFEYQAGGMTLINNDYGAEYFVE